MNPYRIDVELKVGTEPAKPLFMTPGELGLLQQSIGTIIRLDGQALVINGVKLAIETNGSIGRMSAIVNAVTK